MGKRVRKRVYISNFKTFSSKVQRLICQSWISENFGIYPDHNGKRVKGGQYLNREGEFPSWAIPSMINEFLDQVSSLDEIKKRGIELRVIYPNH